MKCIIYSNWAKIWFDGQFRIKLYKYDMILYYYKIIQCIMYSSYEILIKFKK